VHDPASQIGTGRWLGLGLAAAIVALALLRLLAFGWANVAQDDARYLYVGLSVLDGRGAVTEAGRSVLIRSPLYGMTLALPARILGVDPFAGGHVVAAALTIGGLLGALRLAWLLGGPAAALLTAAALAADPYVWWLLPTMRVDPAEAAGLVGVILLLAGPTLPRALAGGGLFGLTVLVKEAAVLAAFLPLAWLGSVPPRRVVALGLAFGLAALVVAGWWWVYVFTQTGALFPLNAIVATADRGVRSPVELPRLLPGGLAIAVAIFAGITWAVFAWQHRDDPRARLLMIAGGALVPPSLFAYLYGLHARQFAPLVLLTSIAGGAAAASALRSLALWGRQRRSAGRRQDAPLVSRSAGVTLSIVLAALVVTGQLAAPGVYRTSLAASVADWLRPQLRPGDAIVATFNERSYLAVALYGRASVRVVPVDEIDPGRDPGRFVWIGPRGERMLGIPRQGWRRVLGSEDVRFLVLIGPDAFTPSELRPLLERDPESFVPLTVLSERGRSAEIFSVRPAAARNSLAGLMALGPAAVIAWIGSDDPDADVRLGDEAPLVVGGSADLKALRSRLPGSLCLRPAPVGLQAWAEQLLAGSRCGD
jgi:hypothetical protein